ncbi:MAG: transglycosylase SLT domain-containing protein, partial [Deltaproteobacteria bacterium]|nr:transglycosylase SLT domain-containing protein [Deltaproteobacteria bacterium]
VEFWVDYFTDRGRMHFEKYLERSNQFIPYMTPILKEKGMPQDLVYLAMIESGFHNYARSHAKAVGPWQFISATGKKYGLQINWWIDERRDTKKSTIAAMDYLKELYDIFKSWELAIAAYNSGGGKIARAIRRYGVSDFWALSRQRFLKLETRDYVPKVIAAALIAKNREQFGFLAEEPRVIASPQVSKKGELSQEELMEFEVQAPADLLKISQAAALSYQTVKGFNPELLRWCTPPTTDTYRVKLPVNIKEKFLLAYNHDTFTKKVEFLKYRIKSGETLSKVARHFGIRVDPIVDLNKLSPKVILKVGTRILLPMPNDPARSIATLDLRDAPAKKRSYKRNSKYYRISLKNREGARTRPSTKINRDT